MDRKLHFEYLTPEEIHRETEGESLIFLPVGSMEWHGPHMGMGMDTCNAYSTSLATAEKTGGVVFPPLFIGTETPRSPETLRKVGFTGNEKITGMDFPKNTVRSMYWEPELFERIIRFQLEKLCDTGFRRIVIMNGHGADEQVRILDRLSEEMSHERNVQMRVILTLFEDCGYGVGHAGLVETAIMYYLHPEAVELEQLPDRSVKLKNTRFAIVDNETFLKGGNEDYTVRYDPRDATPEIGRQIFLHDVSRCEEIVEDFLHDGQDIRENS